MPAAGRANRLARMKLFSLRPAVFALACALGAPAAVCAERAPPPPAALPAATPDEARVIVKFKPAAALLRAHALSAAAATDGIARALDARAASLGARHGLALRAGAALSERSQVVHGAGLSSQALAALLARDAEVEHAEPDRRMRRVLVPNDALFASGPGSQGPAVGQWYLRAPGGEVASAIDAVRAWDITTGSAAVVVAVLDTGVRLNHPDLAGKLVGGYDMVNDSRIANDGNGRDSDPSDPGDWLTQAEINANPTLWSGCEAADSSWHGTQVAGLIGAATGNATGMAGAGWNVSVLPVRVLGKCFGYTSDIVAGMRWAAGITVPGLPSNAHPAKVINLSLGSAGACSVEEREAVAEINARGAVVVAAAGNSAGLAAGSPANCAGAIGVAAVRHIGTKVGFSDVGPELSIAAPGGNCVNLGGACVYPLLTTSNSGTQGPGANIYTDSFNISVGTSFASPLVAGTAALMFAAEPALTAGSLRSALMASARPFPSSGVPADDSGPIAACRAPNGVEQLQCYCTSSTCGAGLLDAGAAVGAVVGLRATFSVAPAAPQAGATITLDSSGSTVASGRTIAARAWTLVDGGGAASGFAGATNGLTASISPSAAGSLVVRLTITDSQGAAVSTQQTIVVAAASGGAGGTAGGGGGGGGGGAMSGAWLLALACAVAGLSGRHRTS
jgi:serine protease